MLLKLRIDAVYVSLRFFDFLIWYGTDCYPTSQLPLRLDVLILAELANPHYDLERIIGHPGMINLDKVVRPAKCTPSPGWRLETCSPSYLGEDTVRPHAHTILPCLINDQ